MIRQYDLVTQIKGYNEKTDVALINRAYVFSMKAHGNQRRASGEPYLVHPLEVASILADLKLDDATIAVALLHDTLEDTLASYDELKDLFGKEIADLTEGVTKLSRITFSETLAEQAENYRKLFLAMSQDIRVLLVKLADRLHNMRTLHHFKKEEKRRRIARETMDIFVPLADRIGLYNIKGELEELSFQILEPDDHARIDERLAEMKEQDNLIPRVVEALREELAAAGMKADVQGREKTPYSIWRKMRSKNLAFDQLTDIVAYRIIVEQKETCYQVLGLIHDIYKAIPGRFKDYISAPKLNGYQSLHTSVIGPFGNRMEVQIRTHDMHDIAENGVAAHWIYKHAVDGSEAMKGTQYKWLRQLMETLQQSDDPEEFLENAKLDLYREQVFVFSPKGDLMVLPAGATPLDFAYNIHTNIGNTCQSAKVNGRMAPLRTRLNNGDQVEIITSKNQRPNPGWREFVVSAKARAGINRYLRSQEKDEQVKLGKDILEKAARRESIRYSEKDLDKILEPYKCKDVEDVYAGLAQGRLFPKQIFEIIAPEAVEASRKALGDEVTNVQQAINKPSGPPGGKERRDVAVAIEGLTPGISIHMAKCCNPLPGEKIVGIINTGRGVTIHARGCKNLEAFADQPERFLSVRWSKESEETGENVYVARLRVALFHHPGALSAFTTAVFNAEGNIADLHIEGRSPDAFDIRCDIEVKNLEHFERMMGVIRSLKCVGTVERYNG